MENNLVICFRTCYQRIDMRTSILRGVREPFNIGTEDWVTARCHEGWEIFRITTRRITYRDTLLETVTVMLCWRLTCWFENLKEWRKILFFWSAPKFLSNFNFYIHKSLKKKKKTQFNKLYPLLKLKIFGQKCQDPFFLAFGTPLLRESLFESLLVSFPLLKKWCPYTYIGFSVSLACLLPTLFFS